MLAEGRYDFVLDLELDSGLRWQRSEEGLGVLLFGSLKRECLLNWGQKCGSIALSSVC